MPFTFSHPAIVLPLAFISRRYISLTGLVAGSIAPDFEYFIRMSDNSYYSHTWLGLFWFDLPLSLIIAFVFHLIVRNSLIENLPGFLSKRFMVFHYFSWVKYFRSNVIAVFISIIIGAASHIAWDGFTHAHAQFVEIFTGLKHRVFIGGRRIPFFALLWHISSLIGGIIVLYAIFKLKPVGNYRRPGFSYWLGVTGVMIIIICARLLARSGTRKLDEIVITIISAGIIGLIVIPLVYRFKILREKDYP